MTAMTAYNKQVLKVGLLICLLLVGQLFYYLSPRNWFEIVSMSTAENLQDSLDEYLEVSIEDDHDSFVLDTRLALMPMPLNVSLQEDGSKFILDTRFRIHILEYENNDGRLVRASTRFLARLSGRTGLFLEHNIPAIHSDDDGFNLQSNLPVLVIHCKRKGEEMELGENESYSLQITPQRVTLEAETDLGALHGLETLLQLISVDNAYVWTTGSIYDKPRFPWRGLLIDASRHFMPVHVIQRNLDAMAAVKLNVLHWHLTDDQGLRVESLTYPKLHQDGSDGHYYTQNEIKGIVAFAAERGIRVIPEFDIPGHAASWLVGYPELGTTAGPFEIDRNWGISDHVMDPSKENVYVFLEEFFNEMATLFSDPFVHIGGDEVKKKEWQESATIRQFMRDNSISGAQELQAHFNKRIAAILQRGGKRMIGWDEIFHPQMPQNIVIQSWRGHGAMIEAAKKGYQGILSSGYYIDWCVSTEAHYQNDPLPPTVNLTPEEQKLVLGGEATMWAELVSQETVDSRIWPRTAAIAERLWSPQSVSDVSDMYRRLDIVSYQLEELGITHIKNYEMMLRRLVRGSDITPLKTLVDVLEPIHASHRREQSVLTSFSPLTRVVDAAQPDAPVARKFRYLVDEFLHLDPVDRADKNHTVHTEIMEWLTLWSDSHDKLAVSIARFPILKEIERISVELANVASIGLKAMEKFRSPHLKSSLRLEGAITARASKAPGQTQLAVITAIQRLVTASGH